MTELAAVARSYALLADGSTVEIRPADQSDSARVLAFHQEMSPSNSYLRFFSLSKRAAADEAQRVCRPPGPDHVALLALLIYGFYRHSMRLAQLIGPTGTTIVVRLSAFLLFCIGIQVLWNGAAELLGTLPFTAVS